MAGGLSLLAHGALFAVIASRPHASVTSELFPSTVTFEVRATTVEEPAPAAQPTAVPRTKGRGTIHALARRPKVVTSFAPDASIATVASLDAGDPREESEAEEPEQAAPAPALAKIEEEQPPPTRAPVIAPDTARALRVYDTYPMLLAQARMTRAEVLVEVCVSDHGQVSDAVIAEGGMAAIDHTLRAAIRSWRYRPLVVNGAPTPFCHYMRIKYALN